MLIYIIKLSGKDSAFAPTELLKNPTDKNPSGSSILPLLSNWPVKSDKNPSRPVELA